MKPWLKQLAFLAACAAFFIAPQLAAPLRNHAPGLAVLAGIAFALTIGNPFAEATGRLVSKLLGIAIVGMGFGMNLASVLHAGANGIMYTFIGIALGLGAGLWLGRRLGIERETMFLISVGTSICGGSAIAAAAPVLKAKAHSVALASAIVFALNAVALLLFPAIGRLLGMSETQFGLWAALGIHDTSSVVGATMQYGPEALEVGATVKLARALWIVPVTLFLSCVAARREPGAPRRVRLRVPWFIPCFLAAAALVTCVPATARAGAMLRETAHNLMVATLFLIGANLSRGKLREIGAKPLLHGIILWLLLASFWCAAIYSGLVDCADPTP